VQRHLPASECASSQQLRFAREFSGFFPPQGFELRDVPGKCCGECIKTKCVVDGKLFAIGAEWMSADNCTTFSCSIKDGQTFVSSMMPTCPDTSKCPPALRYTDGCCEKCKLEPLAQQNCLPESLAESVTIGLIQTVIPPHGKCSNSGPVRGITQCAGNCKSGTRFDPCKARNFFN
jgi:von Willebrand factor